MLREKKKKKVRCKMDPFQTLRVALGLIPLPVLDQRPLEILSNCQLYSIDNSVTHLATTLGYRLFVECLRFYNS